MEDAGDEMKCSTMDENSDSDTTVIYQNEDYAEEVTTVIVDKEEECWEAKVASMIQPKGIQRDRE